jgi:diguanylate cyclase (GGDEF)-like protein
MDLDSGNELSPAECEQLKREYKELKKSQERVEFQYRNSLDTVVHYFSEFSQEEAPSNLLSVLADFTRYIVQSDRCTLWLVDRRRGRFWTKFAHGLERVHELDIEEGVLGEAFARNEAVIVNDPYSHPKFSREIDIQSGYRTESLLAMPITDSKGDVIGVFQAVNKLNSGSNFTIKDLENFRHLTAYTKTFLNIENLIEDINKGGEELTYMAERDRLTKLYNSQKMETILYRFVEREIDFSIVQIGIDNLEHVLKVYGATEKEKLIRDFANILEQSIRSEYILGRWKSDQFLVILQGKDVSEAFEFAESIREFLLRFCFQNMGNQTASFGVTEWLRGEDVAQTIDRTEKALQRSKIATGSLTCLR